MDRNNTVSGREDDQRKQETQDIVSSSPVESRTEARRQEAPGPGQPDLAPGRRPETAEPDDTGMSIDERHARADFAGWLEPSAFPARGRDLAAMAAGAAAPDWVRERLEGLPSDETFETIGAAWEASDRRS